MLTDSLFCVARIENVATRCIVARIAINVLKPHVGLGQHTGTLCNSGVKLAGRENSCIKESPELSYSELLYY